MENQGDKSTAVAPQDNTQGDAKNGLTPSPAELYQGEQKPAEVNKETPKTESDPKVVDPKAVDPKKVEEPKVDDKKDGEKKVEGAPETYAEFTAPEGVKLDPEALAGFSTFAKENNMSQEKAQAALNLATAHFQKLQLTAQQQQAETFKSWEAKIKNDPVLGGANYETNLEKAKLGVRLANDPELAEALDSGWGNHPAFFRHFIQVAERFGEDKSESGSVSTQEMTVSEKLYGKK